MENLIKEIQGGGDFSIDKLKHFKYLIAQSTNDLKDDPDNISKILHRVDKMTQLQRYLSSINPKERSKEIPYFVNGKDTGTTITVGEELKKTRKFLYNLISGNVLPSLRKNLKNANNEREKRRVGEAIIDLRGFLEKYDDNGEEKDKKKTADYSPDSHLANKREIALKKFNKLKSLPNRSFEQDQEMMDLGVKYGFSKGSLEDAKDDIVNSNVASSQGIGTTTNFKNPSLKSATTNLSFNSIINTINSETEYSEQFENALISLFAKHYKQIVKENFGDFPNYQAAKKAFDEYFLKQTGFNNLKSFMPSTKRLEVDNKLTFTPRFLWSQLTGIEMSGAADIQNSINVMARLNKLAFLNIKSDNLPNTLDLQGIANCPITYLSITPLSGKSQLQDIHYIPKSVVTLNLANNNLSRPPAVSSNTEKVNLLGNPLNMLGIKNEHSDENRTMPETTEYIIDAPIADYTINRAKDLKVVSDNTITNKKTKETTKQGNVFKGAFLKKLKYSKSQNAIVAKDGRTAEEAAEEAKKKLEIAAKNKQEKDAAKKQAEDIKSQNREAKAQERQNRADNKENKKTTNERYNNFVRNVKLSLNGNYAEVENFLKENNIPVPKPNFQINIETIESTETIDGEVKKIVNVALTGQVFNKPLAFALLDFMNKGGYRKLYEAYNNTYSPESYPQIPINVTEFKGLKKLFPSGVATSGDIQKGTLINTGVINNFGSSEKESATKDNATSKPYTFTSDFCAAIQESEFYNSIKYLKVVGKIGDIALPQKCVTATFTVTSLANNSFSSGITNSNVKKIVTSASFLPHVNSLPKSLIQLWLPKAKVISTNEKNTNSNLIIVLNNANLSSTSIDMGDALGYNFNISSTPPSMKFKNLTRVYSIAEIKSTIKERQDVTGVIPGTPKSGRKDNASSYQGGVIDKNYYTTQEVNNMDVQTVKNNLVLVPQDIANNADTPIKVDNKFMGAGYYNKNYLINTFRDYAKNGYDVSNIIKMLKLPSNLIIKKPIEKLPPIESPDSVTTKEHYFYNLKPF